MNLQMIFRVNGAVSLINGLSFLLLTETYLGMAGFTMTAQLMTLGQAMGVSLIAIGLLSWRTPDDFIWSTICSHRCFMGITYWISCCYRTSIGSSCLWEPCY